MKNKKPKIRKVKDFYFKDKEYMKKAFYKLYYPEYWLYKMRLLKNCHDHFDEVEKVLKADFDNFKKENYKRMLRAEIHFLYFQMVEALFEIIFAISIYDNREIWPRITFSKWKNNYKKIEELAEGRLKYPDFNAKRKTKIRGKDEEITLLRWIFYSIYPTDMNQSQRDKNLENIKKLLKVFAKDFSDRAEYNAYKHSLRFFITPFKLTVGVKGATNRYTIGESDDAITYLEKYESKDKNETINLVKETTKPFDFERDYRCCLVIYKLIENIIITRKYSFIEELHGKECEFNTFYNIKFNEITIPNLNIKKYSQIC